MAKSATKKKTATQPDLFEASAAKAAARKPAGRPAPKSHTRAKDNARATDTSYTAKHIEVLDGL
jgi:hypothetical protein